jgi:ankyrin repeat protein
MSIQPRNLTRRQQDTLDVSLQGAVSQKNLRKAARLIEARANVNSREDLLGYTPLQTAVAGKWAEGCHLLLLHGANIQVIEDSQDLTFLTRAVLSQGHQLGTASFTPDDPAVSDRPVSMAIRMQTKNKDQLLQTAVQDGKLEDIGALLQAGVTLNREQTEKVYRWCSRAIGNKGNPITINTILQHLNITKEQAQSLLFDAKNADYPEIVPTLVKAGLDLNEGLHSSLHGKSVRVLQCFIDLGADKNRGLTFAVMNKKQEFVECLIKAGADKDHGLREAIVHDVPQFIPYFLSLGASKTKGWEIAIRQNRLNAIQALVAAGADINEGLTIALLQGREEIARDFIARGAVPTLKTLKSALEGNNTRIALDLLTKGMIPNLEMLQIVLKQNNIHILEWFLDNNTFSHAEILHAAIEQMSSDRTFSLLFNKGLIPTEEMIGAALQKNNLNFLSEGIKHNLIPDVELWKIAVGQNRIELVSHLTNHNITYSKELGKELLNMAIERRNIPMIRELNRHYITYNTEILSRIYAIAEVYEKLEFAVIAGDRTTAQELIDAGLDTTKGLLYAIQYSRSTFLRFFVAAGADKDQGLRYAIRYLHSFALKELIDAGADKQKALYAAVEWNVISMVKDLIKAGAVPDEEALRLACKNNRNELVEYLLDLGVKPNKEAMRDAVKSDNDLQNIRTLIDHGGVMDEETQRHLMARLVDQKCTDPHLFFLKRPKMYELEVYHNHDFQPLSKIDPQYLTKPILLLNIADYEYPGVNHGAITPYFTRLYDREYEKMAKRFTLVRVMVGDVNKLVSTVDQVKAALPNLPLLHWALNGHGGGAALGFSKNRLTRGDTSVMTEIGKRIGKNGTCSIWGCLNGDGPNNLAQVFSQYAAPAIVFASPTLVSSIVPYTFQLNPTTPVFAPFFQNDFGKPAPSRAYRDGEEIADGYKLPSRL